MVTYVFTGNSIRSTSQNTLDMIKESLIKKTCHYHHSKEITYWLNISIITNVCQFGLVWSILTPHYVSKYSFLQSLHVFIVSHHILKMSVLLLSGAV